MRTALPLLLALALVAPGCGPTQASEGTGTNVVIVLVDQLRKDSMEQWAPRLTALAEQGVVADQMRSVAPWTYPSVVSLLSGLYPQQHSADGDMVSNVLSTFDEALPLLPSTLGDLGYDTAAFITNPFLHTWNPLHAAFDHYDADFIGSQGNLRGKGKIVWKGEMFADTVNASIREHFDAAPPSAPEFTYIHYIDVHGPWKDAPFEADYEASIRWMDDKVVEIYEYLMARYDGDLIFIVTSDHGMALDDDETIGPGETWRVNKKTVHDFNLRIPFVVLPSDHVTEARRFDVSCSNVDVVPTLFDWLEVEPDWPMPGTSLLPLIRGEADELPERAIYARNSSFGKLNESVVYEGRKYIKHYNHRNGRPTATRVFDLVADPREIESLGEELGEVRPLFDEAKGTHGLAYKDRFEAPSSEVLEGLQALGYLGDDKR
ncbi:MAG: sulfatase-like hydrolase/transferase [Planctomycetota bacterium]